MGARPRTGTPLTVRVSYEAEVSIDDVFTVSFIWPSGYICTELVSSSATLAAGRGHVVFDCPILAIQRGMYTVDLTVTTASGILARRVRAAPFRVDSGLIVQGDFYMTTVPSWSDRQEIASVHVLFDPSYKLIQFFRRQSDKEMSQVT